MGSMNVLIGTGAGGIGSGAGGASTVSAPKAGTVQPTKGTETFPIKVQAVFVQAQPYMTPEALQEQIKTVADVYAAAGEKTQKDELTIADIVEILESVVREDGFEAACSSR